MSIKLLVVDDHQAIRTGLKSVFADTDIEIVGEATTAESAVQVALTENPDVVLLDISLPDGDGFDVLRAVKKEKSTLPILMFSLNDDPFWIRRSQAYGASGYVVKDAGVDKLRDAIWKVSRGETYWYCPSESQDQAINA